MGKCMGIEPTGRRLYRRPSDLKTEGGTSRQALPHGVSGQPAENRIPAQVQDGPFRPSLSARKGDLPVSSFPGLSRRESSSRR